MNLPAHELRLYYDRTRQLYLEISSQNSSLTDEEIRTQIIECDQTGCNVLLQGYPILFSSATTEIPTVADELIYCLIDNMRTATNESALQHQHRKTIGDFYNTEQTTTHGGKAKTRTAEAAEAAAVPVLDRGGGDREERE